MTVENNEIQKLAEAWKKVIFALRDRLKDENEGVRIAAAGALLPWIKASAKPNAGPLRRVFTEIVKDPAVPQDAKKIIEDALEQNTLSIHIN